ncbi:MAG: hypothetical protein LBR80_08695 [Deltaproteobacteria bacterium]|jgi:hypothetical protein|nr:hypothetical protein [Deltaproteobacteria bacterium]
MQVENRNSYNTLGRMGPIYQRPEYRPPQNAPDGASEGAPGEAGKAGNGAEKGQKSQSEALILSPRLKGASASVAADTGGRLNVQSAKVLAENTAEMIAGLEPRSERGCPHRKPEGHGLLYPVYA